MHRECHKRVRRPSALKPPLLAAQGGEVFLFLLSVFLGSKSSEALEVFREEGGIGEVEVVGNAGDGLVGVHQLDFYAHDEGAVNPFLGSDAAGLADDGAEVALSEAEAVGIVADLVLSGTVLIDELDEAVEDGLLARLGG